MPPDVQSPRVGNAAGAVERRDTFRRLHQTGCFVIPNPWDLGSARFLVRLGFRALATTSAGFAWSRGRPDGGVSVEEVLTHLREISGNVPVPVNADFEDGYAAAPAAVAANVAAAVQTGIAGLSIEDLTRDGTVPLFELSLAVERVRAAREAIDTSGTGVLLTGRSEGFRFPHPDLDDTIRRLRAYAEAGAECLYAPGLRSLDHVRAIVDAVAPKPVNVLVSTGFATVAELASLGVRRISVGGALARTAWAGAVEAAREIADRGTFTALGRAPGGAEINSLFE